ncbi:16797_t:CDS:1, partial [Dentiscutata heterogama]
SSLLIVNQKDKNKNKESGKEEFDNWLNFNEGKEKNYYSDF